MQWGMNLMGVAGVATLLVVGVGAVASPAIHRTDVTTSVVRPVTPAPTAAPRTPPQHVAAQVTLKPRPRPKPHVTIETIPLPPPTLDFVISSFNALGNSHTAQGGNKQNWAAGRVRMRWATDLLRLHQVDVVGFQELQTPQLAAFDQYTGGQWSTFPGFRDPRGTENSLAWRNASWKPLQEHTIQIPYFDGHNRPMPYVLLESPATGIKAWFANFHNPADTRRFPHQSRWRAIATGREVRLVNALAATGVPVFLTGDMNERAQYFCSVTGSTTMIAAHLGAGYGGPGCQPPRARAVDWIFGSPDVTFSNYNEDRSPMVRRTTDHPVLTATAHLVGKQP